MVGARKGRAAWYFKEVVGQSVFLEKVAPFLIPKMQTSCLQIFKKGEHSWVSRKLIDQELIRWE